MLKGNSFRRECGGTVHSSPATGVGMGLSPRGAGEPVLPPYTSGSLWVYPRVGGGTSPGILIRSLQALGANSWGGGVRSLPGPTQAR